MHARQRSALLDDFAFALREFFQAALDFFSRCEELGELHIRRVVPGLRFEQTAVELGQFSVRQPIAENREPFATAGFNEGRDQAAIDGPTRFLFADQLG